MRKHIMYLVRGLPGSGKTTVAEALTTNWFSSNIFAADDFFVNYEGVYNYDPSQIKEAHEDCQKRCEAFLKDCHSTEPRVTVPTHVTIHNTFSERWEMEPYFDIAKSFVYSITVVDLFDGGLTDEELANRNIHGVELETIYAMRKRWEHNWREGNPTPPWERELARR